MLGPLILCVLLVVAWQHTLVEMFLRWFPAWQTPGLTLSQRLTEGSSYYSHGPLVPIAAAALAVVIHKRVGIPIQRTPRARALAWTALLTFLVLHLVSTYARVTFVSGFALIGVLMSLLLMHGGWRLFRAYAPVLTTLAFAVPLPMFLIADLNLNLKLWAGTTAAWITGEMFGVPAVLDGSYLLLAPDAGGGSNSLLLGNVCSGLRSLIALTWFGALVALTCRLPGLWRWTILAASIPAAILCNVLRIAFLILMAHRYGTDTVLPGGLSHDMSGLLVFVLAVISLIGLEYAGLTIGRIHFKGTHPRPSPTLATNSVERPFAQRGAAQPVTLGVLTVVALLCTFWSGRVFAQQQGHLARRSAPSSFRIADQTFVGYDIGIHPATLAVLETDDCLLRRYLNRNTGESVYLFIAFSADNRKGFHPPQVCLEAAGHNIVAARTASLQTDAGDTLVAQELITERAHQSWYHFYIYKAGRNFTHDFLTQQASVFLNQLARREATGALVHISAPTRHGDADRTKVLVRTAAAILLPIIQERLP